jgi:hypothetical protein
MDVEISPHQIGNDFFSFPENEPIPCIRCGNKSTPKRFFLPNFMPNISNYYINDNQLPGACRIEKRIAS